MGLFCLSSHVLTIGRKTLISFVVIYLSLYNVDQALSSNDSYVESIAVDSMIVEIEGNVREAYPVIMTLIKQNRLHDVLANTTEKIKGKKPDKSDMPENYERVYSTISEIGLGQCRYADYYCDYTTYVDLIKIDDFKYNIEYHQSYPIHSSRVFAVPNGYTPDVYLGNSTEYIIARLTPRNWEDGLRGLIAYSINGDILYEKLNIRDYYYQDVWSNNGRFLAYAHTTYDDLNGLECYIEWHDIKNNTNWSEIMIRDEDDITAERCPQYKLYLSNQGYLLVNISGKRSIYYDNDGNILFNTDKYYDKTNILLSNDGKYLLVYDISKHNISIYNMHGTIIKTLTYDEHVEYLLLRVSPDSNIFIVIENESEECKLSFFNMRADMLSEMQDSSCDAFFVETSTILGIKTKTSIEVIKLQTN
ncbi:MAG: hypothetical protein BWY28_01600 [bacterium ADurb.Bin236]|nr:MAG: hypothetical protein BWY28_01600 [bacterium ADurb.Bin236]